MCTKNYDQMMYGSWDMVRDRCNCYFSFWAIFCPFTPLTAQKIKILEKWKKGPGDITILHICTKNYDQMMYGSWDMVCDRCNCYFSFWAIFCPFTPLTDKKNQNFEKMKKISGDIIIKSSISIFEQFSTLYWQKFHFGMKTGH